MRRGGATRRSQCPPSIAPAWSCSRRVPLVHRRNYEWNRLDRERRWSLCLRLKREFGDFFALGLHEIRSRQLNVLNKRRGLEGLHKTRERLNVDRMTDDLELQLLRGSEQRIRVRLLYAIALGPLLLWRLRGVGAVLLHRRIHSCCAFWLGGLRDFREPGVLRQRVRHFVHQVR